MDNYVASETNNLRDEILKVFCTDKILEVYKSDLVKSLSLIFELPQVKKLLEDEQLVETIELFFDKNLNISSASKCGYMHRNTLIYRLDKIKNTIGLDIRIFNDAVVFINLITFYNIFKKLHSK